MMEQGMIETRADIRPGQIYRERAGDEIEILRLESNSVFCSVEGRPQTQLPLDWFAANQVRLVQDWRLCGDYPGDDQ